MFTTSTQTTLATFLLLAAPAMAAPIVPVGSCERLVGVGALAPETFAGDARKMGLCEGSVDQDIMLGPVGSHSLLAFNGQPLQGNSGCHVLGWIGNAFEFDSPAPVEATVSIDGWYEGLLGIRNTQRLLVQLVEEDGAEHRVVAERVVFDRTGIEWDSIFDERFSAQLTARLRPGFAHRARILLEAHMGTGSRFDSSEGSDFGLTPGRGFGYDAIEVCLRPVEDLTDIRAALAQANASLADLSTDVGEVNAKADEILSLLRGRDREDIEWRLYQKDCVPSLWLPAAHGGKLERARELVETLADAAEASGAAGPNLRLARQKLAAADADIADTDYQGACWLLTEALRALTTP